MTVVYHKLKSIRYSHLVLTEFNEKHPAGEIRVCVKGQPVTGEVDGRQWPF